MGLVCGVRVCGLKGVETIIFLVSCCNNVFFFSFFFFES